MQAGMVQFNSASAAKMCTSSLSAICASLRVYAAVRGYFTASTEDMTRQRNAISDRIATKQQRQLDQERAAQNS